MECLWMSSESSIPSVQCKGGSLGTYAHVCQVMGINILAETMKTVLLSTGETRTARHARV